MEKELSQLFKKGGETLELLFDGLGALANQLADVKSPLDAPEPREVYERMAEDLKKWGFMVPLGVALCSEEDLPKIQRSWRKYRWNQAKAIRQAQQIILQILDERKAVKFLDKERGLDG